MAYVAFRTFMQKDPTRATATGITAYVTADTEISEGEDHGR